MDRNVCVVAGGMSQWGVRDGSQRDFFQEAAKACYDDSPQPEPQRYRRIAGRVRLYRAHLLPDPLGTFGRRIRRNQAEKHLCSCGTPLCQW